MKHLEVDQLAAAIRAGSRGQLARAITLIESSRADHRAKAVQLLKKLQPYTGNAIRLGISGVPGSGKSTLIDALGMMLIEQGHRVAVLAVDPSSGITGGSILGDRTRMAKLSVQDDAFIRPSPSGGHLGGVARATRETMLLTEAAGYDVVIVETVGVGQSEVAVAGMVDTFLYIHLSGGGDQLQGIKRGILEMANVIAVNKADGDNAGPARVSARDLSIAMKLISSATEELRPPVLTCSAYTLEGLPEVWQAVLHHRNTLIELGQLEKHRADQQIAWLWAQVDGGFEVALRRSPKVKAVRGQIEADIISGRLSALEGSQLIMSALREELLTQEWLQIGVDKSGVDSSHLWEHDYPDIGSSHQTPVS